VATDFDRDDPDEPIHRLLKGARRHADAVGGPGPSCLDAESLAAWSEGALAADRAREVEAHLAGCAYCRSMLAAFADTESAPVVAPASGGVVDIADRRRRLMRWVPLAAGTLAASLLFWTWTTRRPDVSDALPAPAQVAARLGAEPVPQTSAGAAAAPKAATAASAAAAPTTAAAPTEAARLKKNEVPTVTQEKPAAALVLPAASPAPPVAAPQTVATRQVGQALDMAFAVTAGAPVRVIAEFSPQSGVQVTSASEMVAPPVRSDVARSAGAGRGGAGAGRGGGSGSGSGVGPAGAAAPAASTTEPPARWRILSTGVVERSQDNGVTWTAATIDPPEPGVRAGSASSATVCWLVGRGGRVLLSTDGIRFLRVSSPADADLTTVRAVSATEAVVTAADGRTFRTTDAGKTWREGA
jgi:hypothetical protein